MALAPLAIPMIALTAVAGLVLLAPVLAVGLLAGLIALPILLVRATVRQGIRASRRIRASAGDGAPAPERIGLSLT